MMNTLTGILAAAAVAAASLTIAHPMTAARLLLPPCGAEDSAWCYWDTSTRGNGTGANFISLWPGARFNI